jgi:hypothetical protein
MAHLQLVRDTSAVEAIATLHQPEIVRGQRFETLGHAALGFIETVGTAIGATVIANVIESPPMPVAQKGFYIGVLTAASIALGRAARDHFKASRL